MVGEERSDRIGSLPLMVATHPYNSMVAPLSPDSSLCSSKTSSPPLALVPAAPHQNDHLSPHHAAKAVSMGCMARDLVDRRLLVDFPTDYLVDFRSHLELR
jgi:hypothetical protein